jgi:hypothetical protein
MHETSAVRRVSVARVPENLHPRIAKTKAENNDRIGIRLNVHLCGRFNRAPGNRKNDGGFHIIPGSEVSIPTSLR